MGKTKRRKCKYDIYRFFDGKYGIFAAENRNKIDMALLMNMSLFSTFPREQTAR
jgi:transposase-like protein